MRRIQTGAAESTTWRRIDFANSLVVAGVAAVVASLGVETVHGQAAPVGPFTVDMADRENVRRFYYTVHEAPVATDMAWTGNLAACDPGTISADYLDATLRRTNYFRAMAGVPSDVTFTPENNAKAQATALMMSAPGAGLSHDPPMTWPCWTQLGRDGAAESNLALGNTGPAAIDSLMHDGEKVGHRRNMLDPRIVTMGSGSVPQTDTTVASEAQLVLTPASAMPRPIRDEFIAWPPPGFVPFQTVYPLWSLLLRGADFANATVTMQREDGTAMPVNITHRNDNFGGPAIVWLANGLSEATCNANSPQPCVDAWQRPVDDERITVTVGNILVDGAARSFTYAVTVFDPAVADPARTPLTVTGPTQPPLNQVSAYRVNEIPNATGYQWRTSKLTPYALSDGAEAGIGNFDALVGGYDPVSNNLAATGTSAFRLTTGQAGGVAGSGPQTLTLKPLLVPNANTQLTFKTRANQLANVASVVEVSPDDGANWTVVYTEQAITDNAWNDRGVPLGAWAGQHVRLRLRVQNAGTGATNCCFSEGWYVDDITLRDLQAADAPVVAMVSAAPSLDFTPTEAAEFDIDVRAQFVGSGLGPWSRALRVSTLPAVMPPSITAQPQNATVRAGADASFNVTANGTTPLSFVWSRIGTELVDGVGVSGTRTATLSLTNVQPEQAGSYRVQVSNAAGTVTSSEVQLTVDPTPPPPAQDDLTGALDGAGLPWTTAGDANWNAQTTLSHDGMDAARSGVITDNQVSRLELQATGPATLSFWWKVSSERNFDFLTVQVDGVAPIPRISGEIEWTRQTIDLPAGMHAIVWTYTKDSSVSVGQDAAWLDEVALGPAAATPPPQAVTLSDAVDAPAGVTVTASGNSPWLAQNAVSRDGADAAQSGRVGDNQSSSLEATVNGPAKLSFWWKVDSEQRWDTLSVTMDGAAPIATITGNIDWQMRSLDVPAGAHSVRWTYAKDGSVSGGADAAWVDQLTIE
jgi:uncharacterized protein YkwD